MKYGNYVVMQMRPLETYCMGFYSVANETIYGVFEMVPYPKNIGVANSVEKSFKVGLIASRSSTDMFPNRAWYTDIFSCQCYKEFDCVNEAAKADGFCKIQNDRLRMLRSIKKNPEMHIWFKDTKGDIHKFFYNTVNERYYEVENGHTVIDNNGIVYATEHEMEQVMFKIDWEYNTPMELKYNSLWKQFKNTFK